ncbi:hypothetical protein ETD86_21520 [Nonomuraea turkmeniaca]|uniref:Uncharacterized protein n=1 Tax=Nonomuraea turkmeniaca TaxID=103838 RepID=A0A5S4FGM0_9ACTN|nr:hypothetical protein [Nonomuraea turkmeniaca]TMR18532.1 hypothetical protein ETD86_21520 [Nonomuraea turkmeniaca]
MKRSALESSLLELVNSLAPSAVSQFLASHDWELESRQEHVREIWRLPDRSPQAARIMLPLATDFVDFSERFYDALRAIGRVNDWDADRLYERIIATRSDLLYIRLDQAMPDGTIPIRQAEATIESIYRMMKAAATTTADPSHSHRGRRSAAVTEFLDDDVRLGHTKRGSFVFTVVARLEDESSSDDLDAQVAVMAGEPSFQRRVMQTLARGLQTTNYLARGQAREAFADPAAWGLSANLVEALEEMAQPEGLRALDLSFEWAASEARPDVGTEPIHLEHEVFPELARVKERLVRQEEPSHRETLVGHVRSLTREESAGEEETGTVVIRAVVRGRDRNVHVTLFGEDHDWAIRAYRAKIPLTVTGDLVYERQAWRLQGEIELDTSFLRHTLGDDPED